jgi:succinate-acetate transporter protein
LDDHKDQEALMQDTAVCPFYDHDEDVCDVGCGYISSHDASMIIKFCSCQYQDCQKYRELSSRFDLHDPAFPVVDSPAASQPPAKPGNLPVLGLFSYGVSATGYALDTLPVLSVNLHCLAIVLMLGAIGQITAGLNNLKSNPLRAIAFTGSGLFWLSILALDILPRAGYGSIPGSISMMGYFAMWGMFSLIICQGFEQLTRLCRMVFVMMTGFLLTLAVAHVTASNTFMYSAALLGLASSLPGFYLAMRHSGHELRLLMNIDLDRSSKIRP